MTHADSKSLLFVLGFLAAAALVAAIFFLGRDPQASPQAGDRAGGARADESVDAAAHVNPGPPPGLDGSARDAMPTGRAAIEAPTAPLPAAYEKALSGIVGRVVEPSGTPVKGADVELLGGMLEMLSADVTTLVFHADEFDPRIEQQKVKTGADGRFHFERVDPRQYYLLGVNLGGGPRPQVRFVDRTPNAGEPACDLGDVILDPPLTYTGRLVDRSNRPVAGARLRATALPAAIFTAGVANVGPETAFAIQMPGEGTYIWNQPPFTRTLFQKLPFPAATTGPDGAFRLEGIPAGQVMLLVDGADLPPAVDGPIPATKASEKDLGDVSVDRGEDLEGFVHDEAGKPVGGAEVRVGIPCPLVPKDLAFLRAPVRSQADGSFVVKGIDVDKVRLFARAPDATDWFPCGEAELTGDPVVVKIPGPRTVLVRVQDSDGKPLSAELAIQLGETRREGRRGFSPLFVPHLAPPLRARTAPVEPGAQRILGLRAASYVVHAHAPGFAVQSTDVKIEPQVPSEPEITLTLERADSIQVTVLGKQSGSWVPLEAASVFVASENEFQSRGFQALGSARTGRDGVAHPRLAKEGKNLVFASHPGYANARVEVQTPDVKETTIQLQVGGTIEGELLDDGKPPAQPASIVLSPIRGSEVNLVRFAITDLDGKFRFTHLVPGTYLVTALTRVGAQNLASVSADYFEQFWFDDDSTHAEATVEDEAVAHVRLDRGESGGRAANPDEGVVRGRVVKNGAPLPKVQVNASGEQWKRARTDENGHFEIRALKPGKYGIEVQAPGRQWGRLGYQRIEVKPGDLVACDFEIWTGGPIRGTVRSSSGGPVAACQVQLYMQPASASKAPTPTEFDYLAFQPYVTAFTDSDGEFEFAEAPLGSYRLHAAHSEHAPANVQGIRVERGSTPPPLSIVLPAGVTVAGTVDAPGSEKFAWSGLSFQSIDDPSNSSWVNLENGKDFKVSSLISGRYTIHYFGSEGDGASDAQYEPITIEVPPGGLLGLSLRFEKRPLAPVAPPGGK